MADGVIIHVPASSLIVEADLTTQESSRRARGATATTGGFIASASNSISP